MSAAGKKLIDVGAVAVPCVVATAYAVHAYDHSKEKQFLKTMVEKVESIESKLAEKEAAAEKDAAA